MTDKERDEFQKRKSNAERQLNDMYYSSAQKDPQKGIKVPSFITPISNNIKEPVTKPKEEEKQQTKSNPLKAGNLLNILNWDNLKMDSDRLLILAVLFMLLGDSNDELLMLAFLYILI